MKHGKVFWTICFGVSLIPGLWLYSYYIAWLITLAKKSIGVMAPFSFMVLFLLVHGLFALQLILAYQAFLKHDFTPGGD